MYLQLADNGTRHGSTWVNGYTRKANRVRGHNRYLNDGNPINYIRNKDGVLMREDLFYDVPTKELAQALADEGYDLAGIGNIVKNIQANRQAKKDVKIEKKESKNAIRFAKADAKTTKAEAKLVNAESGKKQQIVESISKALPQVLDTVGNVIGVVKGGTVEPVEPGTVSPNATNPASSFWNDQITIAGIKIPNKVSIPVGIGIAALITKKVFLK